uniref:Vesicle transport protein SEC20 n=2 Tax=Plectus sambesii TaxID=2011161 RepID=A0A914W437_9BILA
MAKSADQKQLLELQLCQQEIVKIDVDIKNRVAALRSARQSSQRELSVLGKEIKDRLKLLESKVDNLEEIAGKIKKPADRSELMAQIVQHRAELDRNGQNLRAATLQAMQMIERESRDALFRSANVDEASTRLRQTQSSNMRHQASKTTDSLSQLVTKMSDQVKMSEDTTTSLVNSSSVLRETEKEFGTMGATIQSGGKLLSKYARRELTDKILIALALCLFFGVVYYILRKRVFRFVF